MASVVAEVFALIRPVVSLRQRGLSGITGLCAEGSRTLAVHVAFPYNTCSWHGARTAASEPALRLPLCADWWQWQQMLGTLNKCSR